MAVVVETTLGDITIDLFLKERPKACLNFLKLCKLKYYNYNLFHTVSRGFIAQTGDPTGSRNGGESIFGVLEGPLKRFFLSETNPRIKHTVMGLVSFVGNEENMVGSQFFFTLGEELTYLDNKHCVFGQVTEGLDVLELINEAICDSDDRPYQDIRITHTVILDDPLPDLPKMVVPSRSPSPSAERLQGGRIAPDEEIDETAGKSLDEINEMAAEREAKARATILEMVGDIPDVDVAPPENVLFVCKLNPVTTEDDLEIIFSRFGKIKSCEVIKDHKTGDSLQYAFVEFEEQKSCEDAYFKMDNVLIDDRRIHVDFSQSVSKVKWLGKGRGVKHFNDENKETKNSSNKNRRNHRSRSRSIERNYNYKEDRNDRRPSNKNYDNRNYSRRDNHSSRRYENDRNRSNSSRNYYNDQRDYRDNKVRREDTRRNGGKRRNRSKSSSPVEAKRHTSRYENSSKTSKKKSNRDTSDSSSNRSTENKRRIKKRNLSKDRYKDQNERNGDQRSRKRSRSIDRKTSRRKRSSSSSSFDDKSKQKDKSSSPESPPKSKKNKRKEKSRSSSSDSYQEKKNKTGKSKKVEKSSKKSRKRSSSSDSSIDRKLDKNKSRHKKRN